MREPLKIGLLLNPVAGIGGSLAMKGSDTEDARRAAQRELELGTSRCASRVSRALARLEAAAEQLAVHCWAGPMGETLLAQTNLSYEVHGDITKPISAASDTRKAAAGLVAQGIDLLVFAGGDGTARDVFDVVGSDFPVLGIPAGVKMHSGVFAVSPEAAGELLVNLAQAGLVDLALQEVRDIDEIEFRQDRVRTKFYGDMLVPAEGRYMQHTKIAGRESAELVGAEIAAGLVERMETGELYIVGPGSTTSAFMGELGLPNTLLGVDIVRDGELLCADADEVAILNALAAHVGPVRLLVTAIGGQGHIFGRGNQQLSQSVIKAAGLGSITVVAAKSKVSALEGRPLLVDTNNPELDRRLSGYRSVVTGYTDRILYPVSASPWTD